MGPLSWALFGFACAAVTACFAWLIIRNRRAPARTLETNMKTIRPAVWRTEDRPPPGTVDP